MLGAFGTRGDVQPMVALSQALKARGHQISMAAPPNALDFLRGFGLEAQGAGMDFEAVMKDAANGSLRDMLKFIPLLAREVTVQLEAMEALADSADVIVGASAFAAGEVLSDRLKKPYAYFAFSPQLFRSSHHPSPSTPFQTMPRWLNRLTWVLNALVWNTFLLGPLTRARLARGLTKVPDVWRSMVGRHPVLACDPALAIAPDDHHVPVAQPGALFAHSQGTLSPEVSAFLAAGQAPVYLGFGSMSDPDPKATSARIVEAVRRAGVRALVSRGWAGLSADPPEGVLFVGPEPHDQLFPRCAAVVHHGGAGTTHASARAGVPQVVMPQLLDQHYWAHRVWTLGLGPRRVARHAKNPEHLAQALRALATEASYRDRARALAERMQPNGADAAAAWLEKLV